MATLEQKQIAGRTNYVLDGKALANGDEVELRLRGNQGWQAVTIAGLPERLRIKWPADDGRVLTASLTLDADLRWP